MRDATAPVDGTNRRTELGDLAVLPAEHEIHDIGLIELGAEHQRRLVAPQEDGHGVVEEMTDAHADPGMQGTGRRERG